jgi:hypothetical protein
MIFIAKNILRAKKSVCRCLAVVVAQSAIVNLPTKNIRLWALDWRQDQIMSNPNYIFFDMAFFKILKKT